MAEVSKNARTGSNTQNFYCSCGGEVKMKSIYRQGKLRPIAQCTQCNRMERKPSAFNR